MDQARMREKLTKDVNMCLQYLRGSKLSLTQVNCASCRWTQFDHVTSVMNAYGAPYDIKAVNQDEIEGGANALNVTKVGAATTRVV